uniref:C2 domain-containing protein n=1 Tax=Anolis carolinensis TaxID=28377 RepID=H9GTR0_ANOCA
MMSNSMKFNGYMKVRIGEAVGLQPTRWSLRHSLFKKGHQLLDPYITVSVDQVRVGQTSTKQKTSKPTYNEEFCAPVTDGKQLELAVFHDTPIGYDDFVANCTVHFHELLHITGSADSFEGWVSRGERVLGVVVSSREGAPVLAHNVLICLCILCLFLQ